MATIVIRDLDEAVVARLRALTRQRGGSVGLGPRAGGPGALTRPGPRRPRPAPVVVDASVAVQGFAHEPGAEAAARPIEDAHVLVAPDLMAAEAATAWWKRARLREMEPVDVQEAVVDLSLALAVERGASLATADERLRRAAVRLALPVWSVRARVGR